MTYAAKYGIRETAMRMDSRHKDSAEWMAREFARRSSAGSEHRSFWLSVAAVLDEVRARRTA